MVDRASGRTFVRILLFFSYLTFQLSNLSSFVIVEFPHANKKIISPAERKPEIVRESHVTTEDCVKFAQYLSFVWLRHSIPNEVSSFNRTSICTSLLLSYSYLSFMEYFI